MTAVLLIKNRQGAVLPITNLQSLKMDRQANAHEVLRMCADVQDQIGAIRIVGEARSNLPTSQSVFPQGNC